MAMPALAKDELLSLITFGADHVLKSTAGQPLTDSDIDALLARSSAKTAERAQSLEASCQRSLASFQSTLDDPTKGDPSKLYQIDGVEYDSKGVRELAKKLALENAAVQQHQMRQGQAGSPASVAQQGEGAAAAEALHELLTTNWQLLRGIKVCHEPGGVKHSGVTMHMVAERRVAEGSVATTTQLQATESRPEPAPAHYTVDKNEVPKRFWPVVSELLYEAFGMRTLESKEVSRGDDATKDNVNQGEASGLVDGRPPSSSSQQQQQQQQVLVLPYDLCEHFESKVVVPWRRAWKAFRTAKQRGVANDDLDDELFIEPPTIAGTASTCHDDRPSFPSEENSGGIGTCKSGDAAAPTSFDACPADATKSNTTFSPSAPYRNEQCEHSTARGLTAANPPGASSRPRTPLGDVLFQWGNLDWNSTATTTSSAEDRASFIVSLPEIVNAPFLEHRSPWNPMNADLLASTHSSDAPINIKMSPHLERIARTPAMGADEAGADAGGGDSMRDTVKTEPQAAPGSSASCKGETSSQVSSRDAGVVSVAAGGRHTLVCTADGEVWAWGRGLAGQLGLCALGCTTRPLRLEALIGGGVRVTDVSCGAEHSALISESGVAYSFGSNRRGQLGHDNFESCAVGLCVKMRMSRSLSQTVYAISLCDRAVGALSSISSMILPLDLTLGRCRVA